jgi:hypothetical protein
MSIVISVLELENVAFVEELRHAYRMLFRTREGKRELTRLRHRWRIILKWI